MKKKKTTAFWNLVKTIKDNKENNENIDPDIFFDYFKALHSPSKNHNFDDDFAKTIKESLKRKFIQTVGG